jgi:hypothetical protein
LLNLHPQPPIFGGSGDVSTENGAVPSTLRASIGPDAIALPPIRRSLTMSRKFQGILGLFSLFFFDFFGEGSNPYESTTDDDESPQVIIPGG